VAKNIKNVVGSEKIKFMNLKNEFANSISAMLKADVGKYMNLISIIGKKK